MRASPRLSLAVALVLAALGLFRFTGDVLTDLDPAWAGSLQQGPLRHLVRGPSDGTLAGHLNTQWFKVLAIPCAVAGLYVAKWVLARSRPAAQRQWDLGLYRWFYLGLFLAMCTVMEIEKATHAMGLKMAGLLAGENPWLNHAAHGVSLLLGWALMRWLRLAPPEETRSPGRSGAGG